MKKLTAIVLISLSAGLTACDQGAAPDQKIADQTPVVAELKVGNWGPQSTAAGEVPNMQPNGGMGVWIEATGTQGLGEAEVLFGGQPAMATSVQEKVVTAAIAPEQLAEPGKKEVAIRQIATNKVFPVGVFEVLPAK